MKDKCFQTIIPMLVALSLAVVFFGCDSAEAMDNGKESWITKPGSSVGAEAVFIDCRQQRMGEGPGVRKGAVPLLGGRGSKARQGVMMYGKSDSAPSAAPMTPPPEIAAQPQEEPHKVSDPAKTGKPNSIYLSNDDSMSLSSAQRVEYAINHFLPVPPSQLRPHEFLNYYRFEGLPVAESKSFSVKAEITPGIKREETTLALSVRGRSIDSEQRRQAVVTFVVDQSGSMGSANKMSYLKRGMKRVYKELKSGDVLNIVQFNHQVCVPLEGFVVGRDKPETFEKAVDYLESWGSTNLHDGMVKGYELAEKFYESPKNNRVLMITDAMANTGVVNEQLSSTVTRFYDKRRIALSGIGVGHDFNDRMLNQLTEKGKGAYLFLASESAVDRVFGDKFVSLLEVVARDVHFKLTLPDSLKMETFYGEESSTEKEKVQPIHYFANSQQLFLSDLKGEPKKDESIRLDIEFHEPQSGEAKTESFEWKAAEILADPSTMINKARLIMSFTDLLGETGRATWHNWHCWSWPCYRHRFPPLPPVPPRPRPDISPLDNKRAAETCRHYEKRMKELGTKLKGDPEVDHVLGLQEKYCGRFEVIDGKK